MVIQCEASPHIYFRFLFVRDRRLLALLITGLPNPVGICIAFRRFYWVAKTSRNLGFISWVFLLLFLFFSVSGKVLPVTPLLSGVFVHRVFFAYVVRFQGAGVMRRFPCTKKNI